MKKISLLIAFALVLSLLSAMAFSSSAIYYDVNCDFENCAEGVITSRIGKVESVNIVCPELGENSIVTMPDGNKVAKLHHPWNVETSENGYDNFLRIFIGDIGPKVVVEYDFMFEYIEGFEVGAGCKVWFDNAKTNSNKWILPFEIWTDGWMYCADYEADCYEPGTWHHIAVLYDFENSNFSCFLDNVCVVMANPSEGMMGETYFQYYNIGYINNLKQNVDGYIDNIKVYASDLPEGADPDTEITEYVDDKVITHTDDTTEKSDETTQAKTTEPESKKVVEDEKTASDPTLLISIISGAVLIAAVVVIIIVGKKK